MFELVQELHAGCEVLRSRFTNSISLNAGCELFIAFVTLFPTDFKVSFLHSSFVIIILKQLQELQ